MPTSFCETTQERSYLVEILVNGEVVKKATRQYNGKDISTTTLHTKCAVNKDDVVQVRVTPLSGQKLRARKDECTLTVERMRLW